MGKSLELFLEVAAKDQLSEAASYLFEECYQQGVLTSEFFLDDSRFLGNDPLKPNQALRAAFFAFNAKASTSCGRLATSKASGSLVEGAADIIVPERSDDSSVASVVGS